MCILKNIEIITDKNRKEATKHETRGFPFALYENVIKEKKLGYISWHWHDELQFIYVTEGEVTVAVNGCVVELGKGEGMFINSGVLHMAEDRNDTGGTYICMDFSSIILGAFADSTIEKRYVVPVLNNPRLDHVRFTDGIPWQSEVLKTLMEIYHLYCSEEDAWELAVTGRIYEIWHLMVTNLEYIGICGNSGKSLMLSSMRLKEIVSFIQEHYGERITLKDISGHVHLSIGECCRFFKRNMGCTLFEYIIDFRIGKSMELLEGSALSVAQIAYETGFGSTSYYIEKFRRKTGMTPAAFRKQSRH